MGVPYTKRFPWFSITRPSELLSEICYSLNWNLLSLEYTTEARTCNAILLILFHRKHWLFKLSDRANSTAQWSFYNTILSEYLQSSLVDLIFWYVTVGAVCLRKSQHSNSPHKHEVWIKLNPLISLCFIGPTSFSLRLIYQWIRLTFDNLLQL